MTAIPRPCASKSRAQQIRDTIAREEVGITYRETLITRIRTNPPKGRARKDGLGQIRRLIIQNKLARQRIAAWKKMLEARMRGK